MSSTIRVIVGLDEVAGGGGDLDDDSSAAAVASHRDEVVNWEALYRSVGMIPGAFPGYLPTCRGRPRESAK